MYKSVNGNVPPYISDIIPPLARETTDYLLRNQNNIAAPFCRTEISRKSCIPSSITLWNALDEETRNSLSVSSFKYQMKNRQTNSKVPSFYLTGNRYLSVLHARLRNKCSNLSSDLFRIFLSPSPLCSCSAENEDAEHYLLRRSNFIDERVILFQTTRDFHPLNVNIRKPIGDISLSGLGRDWTLRRYILHLNDI